MYETLSYSCTQLLLAASACRFEGSFGGGGPLGLGFRSVGLRVHSVVEGLLALEGHRHGRHARGHRVDDMFGLLLHVCFFSDGP